MKPHATGDLETDPFKVGRFPRAFAAGFYDGKNYRLFWGKNCIRDFVECCLKFRGLIYLHNGGKFDGHFMLAEILRILREVHDVKELHVFCIGSRMVAIKTPTCEFRDSFALIPKPLAAFGNKKEIEIWKLEKENRLQYKREICDYLKQDCVGLWSGLDSFFKSYGCEMTLASTTFKVLKKKFNISPVNTTEKFDVQFRQGFFAGRVQFFGLGKFGKLDGKVRYRIADINSAFPWSMLSAHWFSPEYAEVTRVPKKFKEQCFYEINCDSDGVLPIRGKNNSVQFPTVQGQDFFVVGWELFMGQKLKKIRRVKIKRIFMPTVVCDFGEYVRFFYDLKVNAANPADREFAKLMLNSLYGKFALNPREFRDVVVTEWGTIPTPKDIKLRLLPEYGITQRRRLASFKKEIVFDLAIDGENEETCVLKEGLLYVRLFWQHSFDDMERGISFWSLPSNLYREHAATYYNVATAASITSKVRAFLAESMAACRDVLYCDTDSIIAADISALEIADDLGAWKLEKECDAVWLAGKKLYVAHAAKDLGLRKEPPKFFKRVSLPGFVRWYLTKKDFAASWKTASKGVRLPVEDLIAVSEGEERTCTFEAPNYSVFSAPTFTTRTIRRDDKRHKAA